MEKIVWPPFLLLIYFFKIWKISGKKRKYFFGKNPKNKFENLSRNCGVCIDCAHLTEQECELDEHLANDCRSRNIGGDQQFFCPRALRVRGRNLFEAYNLLPFAYVSLTSNQPHDEIHLNCWYSSNNNYINYIYVRNCVTALRCELNTGMLLIVFSQLMYWCSKSKGETDFHKVSS